MKNDQPTTERRRFLTLVGGSAVMLPFVGLAACSSEEPAAPTMAASKDDAAASRPDPSEPSSDDSAMTEARESAEQTAAEGEQMAQNDAGGTGSGGGMPQLSEDNAQAKSLEYKHIASDVDHSRYKEGQQCSNCQLWQGSDSDEWAGCGIFAGKAVKATGWCTAYAAMSA